MVLLPIVVSIATMDTDGKDSEVYRRWDDGFLVRRMRREDVRQVYKWIELMIKVVSDSFPQFHLAGCNLSFVPNFKYLGHIIDN